MIKAFKAMAFVLCMVFITGCHKAGYVDDDMSLDNSRSEDDTEYTLYETKKSIETRPYEKYIMTPENSKAITFNRMEDEYKDNTLKFMLKLQKKIHHR